MRIPDTRMPRKTARADNPVFPGWLGSSAILTLIVAIGACAVGPDFRAPAVPAEAGYRADALAATTSSLEFARVQYREGASSQPQVLDATRLYQQTRIAHIQARAARFSDTAALYAALGGGLRGDRTATVADTQNNSNQGVRA